MKKILQFLKWKTFLVVCFASYLTDSQAQVTWTVGSYVGTGAAHSISGLSFKPDFVFIKSAGTQPAYAKTSTMASTASRPYTSVTAVVTNAITALNASGFSIGTNTGVNTNGTTYYFYAFKAGNSIKIGSYTGNGASSRTITAGAKTEFVLIFPEDDYGSSVRVTNGSSGAYAYDSRWTTGFSVSSGSATPANPAFTSTGFPVTASSPPTNVNGLVYHYVGFVENAGECIVSSFTGNGSDNRNITSIGFKPYFILTMNTSGGELVLKGGNITADASQYMNNVSNANNLIQSFFSTSSGGFQVGSNSDVNNSGSTQYYVVFGGPTGGALPVELLHFDAQRISDKRVNIQWSTASEENNDYFTIERSEDGASFESIGKVVGVGNSTNRVNYEFIDENSVRDVTSYYRLKQTDHDGMSRTFRMIAVPCTDIKREFNVSIVQNPVVDNELVFDLTLPEATTLNMQIIDNLGNIASTVNFYYSKGVNRYSTNIQNLKAGVYILSATDLNGGGKKSMRFVVNK